LDYVSYVEILEKKKKNEQGDEKIKSTGLSKKDARREQQTYSCEEFWRRIEHEEDSYIH
jgi:hypothetical protein